MGAQFRDENRASDSDSDGHKRPRKPLKPLQILGPVNVRRQRRNDLSQRVSRLLEDLNVTDNSTHNSSTGERGASSADDLDAQSERNRGYYGDGSGFGSGDLSSMRSVTLRNFLGPRGRSPYDPDPEDDRLADLADEEERSQRRSEMKLLLCCITLFLVTVGCVVGAVFALRGDDGSGDGGGEGGGGEAPAEALEGGGSIPEDVEMQLADACSLDKTWDTTKYQACHELCQKAECCFLPNWDPVLCTSNEADHCASFKKHCPILERAENATVDSVGATSWTAEKSKSPNPILGDGEGMAAVAGQVNSSDEEKRKSAAEDKYIASEGAPSTSAGRGGASDGISGEERQVNQQQPQSQGEAQGNIKSEEDEGRRNLG